MRRDDDGALHAGRRGTWGRCGRGSAAPTWWPARPMRCRPRATLPRRLDLHHQVDRAHVDAELQRAGGDEAAAACRPSAASSISTRASRASEPWWARATSSPASSLSRSARRSASRRLLTKISVVRWAWTSSSSSRVDRRPDRAVSPAGSPCTGRSSASSGGAAMSSTGTTTSRSSSLRRPASTIVDLAGRRRGSARSPPAAAASPTGRCAARAGRPSALQPLQDSARCAPRLVAATAWISSTITVSTRAQRLARVGEVSSRYRLSGVVMRMSGGRRSMRRALALRRVAGAHARREMSGSAQPEALGGGADAGQRRRAGCARRRS